MGMMKKFSGIISGRTLACALLASTCLAAPLAAQAQQQQQLLQPASAQIRVDRIIVQGNERIESSTIISYLPIQIGQTVDDEDLDRSIEVLGDSGLFANINVFIPQNTNDLIVVVEENPIINRVIFEGNRALDEERLLDEIQARPRSIFTPARAQADVQRIIEVYRQSGRIAASVEPKVVQLPQSRVDLVFEIDEGSKSGILDVNFLGNTRYSDADLREVIVTERSAWWKLFTTNDNYDPDRLEFDVSQLRTFYRNRGYYDVEIVSAVAELRPSRNAFVVTYTVDEGQQYTFGELTVETQLNRLNADILRSVLPIQTGQIYGDELIQAAQESLVFRAGSAGFAFVDVIPQYSANPEAGTVDVNFVVTEGPRVYVERIDIIGNNQTLDRVIRREMELVEGDAYNRILVDRSLTNIRGLRFFADQNIVNGPGSAPDRTVLTVAVEEQPTGELSFSAGYSSVDQLVVDLRVAQRNFRGRGQDVVAQVRTGSFQQNVNFSFTEPRWRGRDLSVGWDIYSFRYDFSRQANYETTQTGANFRLGFPLSASSYISTRYNIRNDSITVPSISCSVINQPVLCSQLGDRLTSLAGVTWSIDRRNDPIRPTRGYRLTIAQDIAGLGGDTKFLRTEAQGAYYYQLTPDFIFSANGSAGYVDAYGGGNLRINDRFFKGGSTFRGFETAGLGPRDVSFGNALGGKVYAIGTLEMTVPTFLPEQFGINASLFTDFGTLTGIDRADRLSCTGGTPPTCNVNPSIQDTGSLRASVGVSVGWRSPLGPIQFDFSKVIAKEPYDLTEGFRFSTATGF